MAMLEGYKAEREMDGFSVDSAAGDDSIGPPVQLYAGWVNRWGAL